MKNHTIHKVHEIIDAFNMYKYGFISFSQAQIFEVNSKNRIPNDSKTIIAFVFPYYNKGILDGNISAYCSVEDYHLVVMSRLKQLCVELKSNFPNEFFEPFTDSSPINEVDLFVESGLGVKGKNTLFIDDKYGTFVFLGEIVTTLDLSIPRPNTSPCTCIGCNRCIIACPGNAISKDGVDQLKCASFLNQKKGDLSSEELLIIEKSNSLWGCDICQKVCPHNNYNIYKNNDFQDNIINTLTPENVSSIYKQRAFGFRGLKILLRNLELFYKPDKK